MKKLTAFLMVLFLMVLFVVSLALPVLAEKKADLTFEAFTVLSPNEQQTHLLQNPQPELVALYLKKAGFTDVDDKKIAKRFFTGSPGNINTHKTQFQAYAKSEGVSIEINGPLRGYSAEGFLRGNNGAINVLALKNQYTFAVTSDGRIELVDKGGNAHTFDGDLEVSLKGGISLAEGKLDGRKIVQGKSIAFTDKGLVRGFAKSFDGIVFTKPALVLYNPSTSRLLLRGAHVAQVSTDTSIVVRGDIIVETPGLIKGKLIVPKGRRLEVNGILIAASKKNVGVEFGAQADPKFAKRTENAVRFSDTLQIAGKDFRVKFNPYLLTNTNLHAGQQDNEYIKLPGRGYFQVGDLPIESGVEREHIENIQRIVGATIDGEYSEATAAKVFDWQQRVYDMQGVCLGEVQGKQCILDPFFGEKSVAYVLGQKLPGIRGHSEILYKPTGGSASFAIDQAGLHTDFRGRGVFVKGGHKMSHKDGKLNQDFGKETDYYFAVDQHMSLYDKTGRRTQKVYFTGSDMNLAPQVKSHGRRIHPVRHAKPTGLLGSIPRVVRAISGATADTIVTGDHMYGCKLLRSCERLDGTLDRARFIGVDERAIEAVEQYVRKSGIPPQQHEMFRAALFATIQIESGGVKYSMNRLENYARRVGDRMKGKAGGGTRGTYVQVSPNTLRQAAKIIDRNGLGTIDLNTDKGSIDAVGIVMEAIFKRYISEDLERLSDADKRALGAAFNSGIDSEYAKALAAHDFENIPRFMKTNWKGKFAKKWAEVSGYDSPKYATAYPKRWTDNFNDYSLGN